MKEQVFLRCRKCDAVNAYNLKTLRPLMRMVKMTKVVEVARQLHNKSGPFYDRWLAAMEARGEQKRCKDCLGFDRDFTKVFANYCGYRDRKVNPGRFACHMFIEFNRG